MERMGNHDDETPLKISLEVIRGYLKGEFEGFELTRDHQADPLYHCFTMTNDKTGEQHTLKVVCEKLSDSDKSPDKIKGELETDNVAEKMRTTEMRGYTLWGQGV
jgi:hypothetical protein